MIDLNTWLKEAKELQGSGGCGMYLIHNGVVRETSKKQARGGIKTAPVKGMFFSYDKQKLDAAIADASSMPGIKCVRVWLNEGYLAVGDDIMYVLIGGDIRPNVSECFDRLISTIKDCCVNEDERI